MAPIKEFQVTFDYAEPERSLVLLPADDDNESPIVMQDIAGNEFCLD